MTAPGGLGMHFAIAKWLTDRLADGRTETLLPAAGQEWERGARIPVKADGQLLAWVNVTDPKDQAKVSKLEHVLAWVERHFPGEVIDEPVIRPSFLNALKAEVAANGGYLVKAGDKFTNPDGELLAPGTVIAVPGLTREPGVPQVSTHLQDGAGERLSRLLGPLAGLMDWIHSPDRAALPTVAGSNTAEGVAVEGQLWVIFNPYQCNDHSEAL